jgi:hypothetical protein
MKILKHSKYKNTGLIFELLVRQITSDTIEGNDSLAIPILKRFFSKNTELYKEYTLYSALMREKFKSETKSNMFLESILKTKKTINIEQVNKEKYELIKTLKEAFELDLFFKTQIPNYKLLASIYKVFEYKDEENPLEIVKARASILDHVMNTNSNIVEDSNGGLSQNFVNESKDIRILSYKILVEKFNEKYGELHESQKETLRHYILSKSNSLDLKEFFITEITRIEESITKVIPSADKVIQIKLTEVLSLFETLKNQKYVKDADILKLLKLQDLEAELKGLTHE